MQKHFSDILIVHWASNLHVHNIVTLANYLDKSGFKVTVLSIGGTEQRPPILKPEVEISNLECPPSQGMRKFIDRVILAKRLRNLLKARSCEILYLIDSWTLPVVWFATRGTYRWCGSRSIYHTFDWLEPGLVSSIHIFFEKNACRKVDLIVNADRTRARLQKTIYKLKKTPVSVGNFLSKDTNLPARNELLRTELLNGERSPETKLVIYPTVVSDAGSAERMPLELCQAFAHLPQEYRLIIFYEDGPYYLRCKREADTLGLGSRIKFMRPIQFQTLLEYIACSDIGVIFYDDSRSSGYFMCNADKLSIYVAVGIPFVASDFPNLEALTYRYGLGVCCDPHDPTNIAKAILEIGQGAIHLNERRAHIRHVFENYLNFEMEGPKLVRAMKDLLNKAGA